MSLRQILHAIRRSLWLFIVIVVAAPLVAIVLVAVRTPLYSSTAQIYASVNGAETVQDLNYGGTFTQEMTKSYADVATTPIVLQRVISQLGLKETTDQLAKNIDAEAPVDTVVLSITATDSNPSIAAKVANSTADNLSLVVGSLTTDTTSSSAPVKLTVVRRAQPATAPSSPSWPLYIVAGLLVGLVLALAAVIVRSIVDTRVRSLTDLAGTTNAPILGRIPRDATDAEASSLIPSSGGGRRGEAFRSLRTNLHYVNVDVRCPVIAVSSSVDSEGKTTIASNLAVAIAETGARTLIIDADLRRPKVQDRYGIEGGVGLTEVLIKSVELKEAIQGWGEGRLSVLPAGSIPPNPTELLQSPAMAATITALTEQYDFIILDTPPLLPVSDAAIISRYASGVLLVCGTDKVTRAQLRGSIEALSRVQARLLGVVMNLMPAKGNSSYYYSASYEYSALGPQA